mgnify:CR=1 FL=1
MSRLWGAIDVGGTFIDVVVGDVETGQLRVAKVPHRQASHGEDLAATLDRFAREFGRNRHDLETLIIGTTVVTNALLEGTIARTGLVTTEGYRDVLAIARMVRVSSYDLHARRPPPLVPEELRLEVQERLDIDGQVLRPLDPASVAQAAEALRDAHVEAVAVCFLYSYANPEHEQRVGTMLSEALGIPVTLSSDVLPVFREYERTSTTVVNAAALPVMEAFLAGLSDVTVDGRSSMYVMGSEGGCLTIQEAQRRPAATILSGPSGGVVGAAMLAGKYGLTDVLTLDVGGTSTDVALLRGGRPPYTSDRAVGGYSVALPSIEVHTIGAGGGSLASIDRTGLLRVGPQSSGAEPGPVCYGRGGEKVTVTDCYLALGRLGETTMLGGEFTVDKQAALRAIDEQLARPLGVSWVRAAQGVLEVVTANIVGAVRKISVERGHDPRELTLVAFGGAGPIHALEVARSLEIPRVLIPRLPGVFSAYGMLGADIRYPIYRTWFHTLTSISMDDLHSTFQPFEADTRQRASQDGIDLVDVRFERAADLRYEGQSHTLTVRVDLEESDLQELADRFHHEHERWYGYADVNTPIEIVNVRSTLVYTRSIAIADTPAQGSGAAIGQRQVWFTEPELVDCSVYQRDSLAADQVLVGPAIIEQYDSTVVLAPGDRLEVLDGLDLLVEIRPLYGQ